MMVSEDTISAKEVGKVVREIKKNKIRPWLCVKFCKKFPFLEAERCWFIDDFSGQQIDQEVKKILQTMRNKDTTLR